MERAEDAARPIWTPVWDVGVRLFHWLLLAGVVAALATGLLSRILWLRVHLIAGGLIALLLLWRAIWGVLGTRHARFADFAYPPRAVRAYLAARFAGKGQRFPGHNPLGAMMVFAMLTVLTVLVASGTIVLGGMLKQGPLAFALSYAAGRGVLGIHRLLGWTLLGMIGLHLAGVAEETWHGRENLIRAMITGRKRAGAEMPPAAPPSHPGRALVLFAALALAGAGAVAGLARLPGRGVPPATPDPVFAEQCGACHFAYPPSLAPAGVWQALMGDLAHHFSADASMSPDLVAHIRAYLLANAAGHWDTLPSWRFRVRDPADPRRITATPYWRRRHAGIPASVFATPAVGGKGACDSCHTDAATGCFAPQNIHVPVPW